MKAIAHHQYGEPNQVMRLEALPDPVAKDGEVVVRVRAAGVNWADNAMTRGLPYMLRLAYGLRSPRTPVRGSDVAGTVETVGADVTDLQSGQDVVGWCWGAFAEKVTVPATNLVPKPERLTFEEAAAVPMAGMVALQAMRDIGHVASGDKVLINGASGGIGTFAVQIARAFGAEVTGVCSTPNLELVRSLGADHVVDYTVEDFTRSGKRYDVILDMADTHSLAARRRVLAPHGTLIPNNGAGGRFIASTGRIVKARLLSLFVPQTLRPFLSIAKREDLQAVLDLVESGDVTPVVGRAYQFNDAAAAVEQAGSGHARGKIVISV